MLTPHLACCECGSRWVPVSIGIRFLGYFVRVFGACFAGVPKMTRFAYEIRKMPRVQHLPFHRFGYAVQPVYLAFLQPVAPIY